MTEPTAQAVVGVYGALIYLVALPGGWVADRVLGARRAVFWGGFVIICGLLKPNISVMVGRLYRDADDGRRDSGFSLFYLGINLGAFFAPIVVGWLAEGGRWHHGFAAAAVGMALGLIQYVRLRMRAYIWLFAAASAFWMISDLAPSKLLFFAQGNTVLSLFGLPVQAATTQSFNPVFILVLAPVFAALWVRLGTRVSTPQKFAFALFMAGLSFVVMSLAARLAVAAGVALLVSARRLRTLMAEHHVRMR